MLRAVGRLLEDDYDVLATTDPYDAVARVDAGARFDAILCDLTMPAMSGMDVYDAILRIAPDQARRVVFITGGVCTSRAAAFLQSVDNVRLEKPLDRESLCAAIRAQGSSDVERTPPASGSACS